MNRKLIYFCPGILALVSCLAVQAQDLNKIGIWKIKYYKGETLKQEFGIGCVAFQYKNGAFIEIRPDSKNIKNKNTIEIRATLQTILGTDNLPWTNVGISIPEGKMIYFLNNSYPQFNAMGDIFNIKKLADAQLFVTFYDEQMPIARYEFSLKNLKKVSDYVHQEKCLQPLYFERQQSSFENG